MAEYTLKTFLFLVILSPISHATVTNIDTIFEISRIQSIERTLSNESKLGWKRIAKDKKSEIFVNLSSINYLTDTTTLDFLTSVNIIEKRLETGNYIMANAVYNCENQTFKISDIKKFDLLGNIRNFEDSDFQPIKNRWWFKK